MSKYKKLLAAMLIVSIYGGERPSQRLQAFGKVTLFLARNLPVPPPLSLVAGYLAHDDGGRERKEDDRATASLPPARQSVFGQPHSPKRLNRCASRFLP